MSIDLQHLDGVVVDVRPGGTRGLRREQEGFSGVAEELDKSIPALGATIGISQEVYTRFATTTERINKIREARRTVDKLSEVLAETEAKLEDEREADIGIIVVAVRQAARRKDRSLLAPFEKTVRYHGQVALRAAKTRRRNAETAAEKPESPEPAPQPA